MNNDVPLRLTPITLLPRARFPYSWLDYSSAGCGGLFFANIAVLEAAAAVDKGHGVVLAARNTADANTGAGTYVIERVKSGVYSLHRLGRWVGEGDVHGVEVGWEYTSAPVERDRDAGESRRCNDSGDWWAAATVEDPCPDMSMSMSMSTDPRISDIPLAFETRHGTTGDVNMRDVPTESVEKGNAALMSRLLPLGRSSSFDGMLMQAEQQGSGDAMVLDDNDAGGAMKADAQSPQETLDALREQYLQALYISKVRQPLTYTGCSKLIGRPPWRISPKDRLHGVARRSNLLMQTLRKSWSSSIVMRSLPRKRWI